MSIHNLKPAGDEDGAWARERLARWHDNEARRKDFYASSGLNENADAFRGMADAHRVRAATLRKGAPKP